MTQAPSYVDLASKAGISKSYANQITTGARIPPLGLAVHIFKSTGWRPAGLAELSDDEILALEAVAPWPRQSADQQAHAA